MKKLVAISLLALMVLATSGPQASAWTNSRFSMGLSWEHQSGGNSFGWGLYTNGQVPSPYGCGQPGYYGNSCGNGNPYAPAWSYVPYGASVAPQTPPANSYTSPFLFANYPQAPNYPQVPNDYFPTFGFDQ